MRSSTQTARTSVPSGPLPEVVEAGRLQAAVRPAPTAFLAVLRDQRRRESEIAY
jgi:hypothetical protein